MKTKLLLLAAFGFGLNTAPAAAQPKRMLGDPVDVSRDFSDFQNTFFFADSLASFDAAVGRGTISWQRYSLYTRQAFDVTTILPQKLTMLDFPAAAYTQNPQLPFSIDFITPRTLRIRMRTSAAATAPCDEQMLVKEPSTDSSWQCTPTAEGYLYKSAYGSLEIQRSPLRLILRDSTGRLLTQTRSWCDDDSTQIKVIPFNFIKRGVDNAREINPVFALSPGEKIFGCGESFTELNKRGQKLTLFVTDPQGPESERMYKPVPFFMSSRGYGMFMHTSAPVTCDFGNTYVGATKLFMADEDLDIFLFLGKPKEILNEYTDLVGKPSMPPLWSFGTWMSRISYFSEAEGYEVAAKLRANKIPADVIHFDTGWFDKDWQCDYQFAPSRFPSPQKMIDSLKAQGFHISLWQLPYFTPKNRYYDEIVEKGLCVKNAKGGLPYEDAVLDFSNPATVAWYQDKLAGLLKMGVGAIKVDFGEAAPPDGFYASGRGGLYEHNLYPLRYDRAVADITAKEHGEQIIWARSAWAGSQRYPLHWGGDAANTDIGMDATLRGGLSLGLSGFSFWSHDMGGFVVSSPEDLYRRWLPFGFLSSHTRAHGAPPTEPWLYNESFVNAFRRAAELKYRLMPYVYAQAVDCTRRGLPMVRALFIEYPDDPGAWLVEDAYLFGSDILVAPMLEHGTERDVYLPGTACWIDYQSGQRYSPGWHRIPTGEIPAVILVREGAVIPHARLAQSTDQIDWSQIRLEVYGDAQQATGLVCLPSENAPTRIVLERSGDTYRLEQGQIENVHYTTTVNP